MAEKPLMRHERLVIVTQPQKLLVRLRTRTPPDAPEQKFSVLVAHSSEDCHWTVYEGGEGNKAEVLKNFRATLLAGLQGFLELAKNNCRSLEAKSLKSNPPLSLNDLLSQEIIDRLVADLEQGDADPFEYFV